MAVHYMIDGQAVHVATGGRAHVAGRPWALFVHGAGFDHTAFALQSRWLAFRGWNVLSPDLPGHGRSAGTPLTSIGAMADWSLRLLDAAGAETAVGIGHSMGALVLLEAAARSSQRLTRLLLIGAAGKMPVHPDLLDAAARNHHDAIDMMNVWGHGHAAGIGGSRAPGVWMIGASERILERAAPGVLHADLSACNAYDGLAAAPRVTAQTLLVSGERDMMTPVRNAKSLLAQLPSASLRVLPRAGHMLLAESPNELVTAMGDWIVAAAPHA
jgi:pimeloyl-ACP methyl ester carboxylesterase